MRMILTVDIGNTTVSFCGAERCGVRDYEIAFCAKINTVKTQDAGYYTQAIRQVLLDREIPLDFEGAVLSSVVPCLTEAVGKGVEALIGRRPVEITAESRLGFSLDVKEPQKVGLDRLADAAWAAEHYPLPVVTVDMGTATTFNVIDEGRVFRGGAITAGLETGLCALSSKASQLPKIELSTPEHLIGTDTEECMRSGAVMGAAAMIDGITAGFERELGKKATLLLTGGLARFAAPLCRHEYVYDPGLLPKGLALLYDLNIREPALVLETALLEVSEELELREEKIS